MSGHSKWHQIRHKKGLVDAKRGALFTKAARVITVAAQKGGGDPTMNPSLRTAIDQAKALNMPNANVERAIKKGTGELKEGALFEESTYEGYGPQGVAILIHAVTDNKNRTVSEVKNVLSKHGGSMGTAGCTAWMFEQKGILEIDSQGKNWDDIELAAIDAGADDVKQTGDTAQVSCAPSLIAEIKEKFSSQGFTILSANTSFVPKSEVRIDDENIARKILKLMEALDDLEDVSQVASNFDIPENIMQRIE